MALGEAQVELLGDAGQAGTDQNAGQIQQHLRGLRFVLRLPAEQARHVVHFRVMEQQQRLSGDGLADETLADGAEALAALGVEQGHVQLADFEDIHLRHRQLHEYTQYLGQQRGGAAHGDVADFAQGIAEADLEF